jgi:uncharacterized protein
VHHRVVIVPGIGGSGPEHWQSRWESALPLAQRIAPASWDAPDLDDWVAAIDRSVAASGNASDRPVLVAHSLGCLAVAQWARRADAATARRAGAFLVAPPDPSGLGFPAAAASFSAPDGPLPLRAFMVASTDDPYCTLERASSFATTWGATLVDLGPRGHMNVESGFGEWPEGLRLLEDFLATDPAGSRRAG